MLDLELSDACFVITSKMKRSVSILNLHLFILILDCDIRLDFKIKFLQSNISKSILSKSFDQATFTEKLNVRRSDETSLMQANILLNIYS